MENDPCSVDYLHIKSQHDVSTRNCQNGDNCNIDDENIMNDMVETVLNELYDNEFDYTILQQAQSCTLKELFDSLVFNCKLRDMSIDEIDCYNDEFADLQSVDFGEPNDFKTDCYLNHQVVELHNLQCIYYDILHPIDSDTDESCIYDGHFNLFVNKTDEKLKLLQSTSDIAKLEGVKTEINVSKIDNMSHENEREDYKKQVNYDANCGKEDELSLECKKYNTYVYDQTDKCTPELFIKSSRIISSKLNHLSSEVYNSQNDGALDNKVEETMTGNVETVSEIGKHVAQKNIEKLEQYNQVIGVTQDKIKTGETTCGNIIKDSLKTSESFGKSIDLSETNDKQIVVDCTSEELKSDIVKKLSIKSTKNLDNVDDETVKESSIVNEQLIKNISDTTDKNVSIIKDGANTSAVKDSGTKDSIEIEPPIENDNSILPLETNELPIATGESHKKVDGVAMSEEGNNKKQTLEVRPKLECKTNSDEHTSDGITKSTDNGGIGESIRVESTDNSNKNASPEKVSSEETNAKNKEKGNNKRRSITQRGINSTVYIITGKI